MLVSVYTGINHSFNKLHDLIANEQLLSVEQITNTILFLLFFQMCLTNLSICFMERAAAAAFVRMSFCCAIFPPYYAPCIMCVFPLKSHKLFSECKE
jgi:hypothetical protein